MVSCKIPESSKRYAEPAFGNPVSSRCAPTNKSPLGAAATENPNLSSASGSGLFMVNNRSPDGTNKFSKIHSTVSPFMRLKFSVVPCGIPLIRQSDDIKFQFNGTVSVTLYEPACTVRGAVMLLIDVSGMLTAVEFPGSVELNMVKSKEPSPFVVSVVILMVGGQASTTGLP